MAFFWSLLPILRNVDHLSLPLNSRPSPPQPPFVSHLRPRRRASGRAVGGLARSWYLSSPSRRAPLTSRLGARRRPRRVSGPGSGGAPGGRGQTLSRPDLRFRRLWWTHSSEIKESRSLDALQSSQDSGSLTSLEED